MKILAVADEESKFLWDYFTPDKVAGVDLIIACGDLKAEYLEFLATMASAPVYYVHGNHDRNYTEEHPGGVTCLDDTVTVVNGLRILGLGGSMRYNRGSWQFTEAEMRARVRRLHWRIERLGGIDVLVTHAPVRGLGDGEDLPHRGFECFREILDKYHPQLMLHGHIHLNYGPLLPREHQYKETRVINAFEKVTVEAEPKGILPHRVWFW